MNRKSFIQRSSLGISSLLISPNVFVKKTIKNSKGVASFTPFALATWDVQRAVSTAGKAFDQGSNALDSSIQGAAI